MLLGRMHTPLYLIAERIQYELLNEKKWTLIFSAADEESGVKYVEVQERGGLWKEIQSPYVVQDQSVRSILKVRATDHEGNATIVVIPGQTRPLPALALVVIAVILLLLARIVKIHEKKK
jgi:hypothetical protein